MDRILRMSGWEASWVTRTMPALRYETIGASYLLIITALLVACSAAWTLLRTRRRAAQNPSDARAIFTECDKQMHRNLKQQYYIGRMLFFHAMVVWFVDAGVGVFYIAKDVSEHPSLYSGTAVTTMAIFSLGIAVILIAIMLVVPLLQILGIGYLVAAVHGETGLSSRSFIPAMRILTTHVAQLFSAITFAMVSWWPANSDTYWRPLALQAVAVSALVWSSASAMFLFQSEALENINLEHTPTVAASAKIFLRFVCNGNLSTSMQSLPKYEEVNQTESLVEVANEKQ